MAALKALLHFFPTHPGERPPGTDMHRDVACHCALGCMAHVLAACGVEVWRVLPWVLPWFARYQVATVVSTVMQRRTCAAMSARVRW